MTPMLFDRCRMCDTPDACDAAARCSLRTAAAMDDLIANTPPRARILREAEALICGDRAATHGDLRANMEHLARVWSARLGITITAPQACIMLADLKGARAWQKPEHDDNWKDGAGYYACGGELAFGAEVQP
jgi:hypothetical protein